MIWIYIDDFLVFIADESYWMGIW